MSIQVRPPKANRLTLAEADKRFRLLASLATI
jgi:hypothetical protein